MKEIPYGRFCPVCGKEFCGRADKKFCSDECRIFYNNALGRKRRANNMQQTKIIKACIAELEKADARFFLKILAGICKVFKIMSNFAKERRI